MAVATKAPAPRKVASVTGHLRPALADVLRALDGLSVAVRAALAEDATSKDGAPAVEWITQDTAPIGRRAFMRACRAGLIKGAFIAHRKWHASPDAYADYLREHGRAAAPSMPVAAANDTDEPSEADIARELAAVGLARRGARR